MGAARKSRRLTGRIAFPTALLALGSCAGWAEEPGVPQRGVTALGPHDAGADVEPTGAGARARCAPLSPIGGFVTRHGGELRSEGRPFRVGGTNLYYLQQLFAEAEMGDAVAESLAEDALDAMACLGLPVARIWAFNDHAGIVSTIRSGPGIYHEAGLRGLDRAVFEARRRGIRLVMTLTNNWSHYGGLPAMARWIDGDKDDVFAEGRLRELWRDYARLLADRVNVFTGVRYADEPAILAWEIGNELRCERCTGSGPLVQTVAVLAAFARRTFPNHLIADGGEGFDDEPALYAELSNRYPVGGTLGASYHKLARIPALDMLSYHFYPRGWGLDPGYDAPIWIRRHEEIARAAGKVAYMGEYGLASRNGGLPDDVRAPVYDRWLERLYASSGGLMGFFWQLVPAGRANADNHAVRAAGDDDTVAVVRKWVEVAR